MCHWRLISVGVTAYRGTALADEKVEVAARVCLLDVLGVKPGPAAGGGPRRRGPRGTPQCYLVVGDIYAEGAGRNVEGDHVAGLDQGERAADGGLRGDVQHDRAVGGARHAAVTDPDDVLDAALEQLG